MHPIGRVMKTMLSFVIAGFAVLGCGSGGDDDRVCVDQCSAERTAKCPASLDDCETTCAQSRQGRGMCLAEDTNFRECFAHVPSYMCSSETGLPAINASECDAESTALQNCLKANGEK